MAAALEEDPEAVFHALQHLAANDGRVTATPGSGAAADSFALA